MNVKFCSHCGNALKLGDRFCSSCGSSVSGTSDQSEQNKIEPFKYEFSSRILLGGNILNPDKIIITEKGVTYEKRNAYLIGKDRVHLSYDNISSVRIDRKLIDATIIVSGRGAVEIVAKYFSISSAKKIEGLITQHFI